VIDDLIKQGKVVGNAGAEFSPSSVASMIEASQ
jgi:hypothetical protein